MAVLTTNILNTRLKRLEENINRQKERRKQFSNVKNPYKLPTRDRWPEFAALTKIKTASPERGAYIGPFIPYDYQCALIEHIERSRNTQILKSRQVGASETIVNYLCNRTVTEPAFTGVVISKREADSKKLARRAKFMIDSIGIDFKYDTWSTEEISLTGLGTMHYLPSSAAAGRGIPACSVLFLDEAAFIELINEIYRAASPSLRMLGDLGKIIIASTADFEYDWYGAKWHDGLDPDWYDYVEKRDFVGLQDLLDRTPGDWRRFVVHYSMHPIYSADPNWAAKVKATDKLTQSEWDSEYELKFNTDGSGVYPPKLVMQAEVGEWEECGRVKRSYVMGVDPNAGGDDYFVSMVLDITKRPYKVVNMYREHGKATAYSLQHVKQQIEYFLPERIVVEKEAMGSVIAERLAEEMPKYLIETFSTSRPSKNVITDRILLYLENQALQFPKCVIGSELRAFRRTENGRREAAPGFYDDTVMALAFACSAAPELDLITTMFDHL